MAKKEQTAFLLQKDQKEIIDELSDEEAGIIFKAIYEYECTKKEPKLTKFLKIVFKQFKVKLDSWDKAYEEKCLKNKENIEKRWANIKNATEYDGIQTYTNYTNKIKLNKIKQNKMKENKIKQNEINNKIKENNNRERENNSVAKATTPTLEIISQYGSELGVDKSYCERFYNHYESIGWVNGTGQKIKNWKLIFKNWIARDKKEKTDNLEKIGDGVFQI